MFPDLIIPAQDFEQQLGACVNAMCHDDAIGQTLVFERDRSSPVSAATDVAFICSAELVAAA